MKHRDLKRGVAARNLLTAAAVMVMAVSAVAADKMPTLSEGAYYGVNYTVPFAHAYRALDALGVEHKAAIDRDVYHLARMGMNAFRLHLWDVELSDGAGNLIEEGNPHLDLLDYLIAQLEKRGIAVVLTAQTNFGNGYPERNSDPYGAFSYKYDKCDVHDNPAAQQAQENYLKALVRHVNPYNGKSYEADPSIIALEINNEPCHSGDAADITRYVNRMAGALRDAGWNKDILYNVSHNTDRVAGYYNADIDGTTYQWYPTGLVHGSQRHGNFLPMLDNYAIPFDTVAGFQGRSRVIYEYDPADVLDTYLYPAAARTFRKAGFNWVTQFAYDPIDMARFNTEYQTHFLNLAYTPGKAVGMIIAAEAMKEIPAGKDFGKYPVDTVFGDFTVSARRNLALLNDGKRYYHTNTTDVAPKNSSTLEALAGVGSSPVVKTDGNGAYFLDKLAGGVWRLEVLPDVILTADPFAKPSLRREVAYISDKPIQLKIDGKLPGIGRSLYYKELGADGTYAAGEEGVLHVSPGVYLIASSQKALEKIGEDDVFGLRRNMTVGEYVSPVKSAQDGVLLHQAPLRAAKGTPIKIEAVWAGDVMPDSILVYPTKASFWNSHNKLYRMEKSGKYSYETTVQPDESDFGYRIVTFVDGKALTWPAGREGTPLDWDFASADPSAADAYVIKIDDAGAPIGLLVPNERLDGSEYTTIPEGWRGVTYAYDAPMASAPRLIMELNDNADTERAVITKYIEPITKAYTSDGTYTTLRVYVGKDTPKGVKVGLVNTDGFTYTAPLGADNGSGEVSVVDIPLDSMTLDATILSPAPYPVFMEREFKPDATTATPLTPGALQTLTFEVPRGATVEIYGAELR